MLKTAIVCFRASETVLEKNLHPLWRPPWRTAQQVGCIFFGRTVLRPPAYNGEAALSKRKKCGTKIHTFMQTKKLNLSDIEGDVEIFFRWSLHALYPAVPHAADRYLLRDRVTICKVAQELLRSTGYTPGPIYRGIILREPITRLEPHKNFQYLSFSADKTVAEHFANVNGFGSNILNVETQLGKHGYVIEYTPQPEEVLFHYHFFSLLPYAEVYNMMNLDGPAEVEYLRQQKEVTILQPAVPFTVKRF
jgi:hypothetical protein